MNTAQWDDSGIVEWSQQLLDSYRRWVGKELIERAGDARRQARTLFEASFVVVSHGVELDPILNYGNQAALSLWELSWDRFIKTPSRLTAEPGNRAERERMLEHAKVNGYFDGYRGVRISSTGQRFLVERALIWSVIDSAGIPVGQAATFSQWSKVP